MRERRMGSSSGRPPGNPVALVAMLVFFGLAAVGLPLPALPIHIVRRFGSDMNTVGWLMAMQSMATLLGGPWAGRMVDRRGARYVVTLGLVAMLSSGLAYGSATLGLAGDRIEVGCILAGRVLSGLGEGLVVTGAGTWVVGSAGMDKAGSAMSWIGLAMFGGLAAGASVGALWELPAVSGLIVGAAIVGLATTTIIPVPRIQAIASRPPLSRVIAVASWPGLTLGLSAFGFAIVSSFAALLFDSRGWKGGEMATAFFACGHVGARILLWKLPDRGGNLRPTLALILAECAGILLISAASTPTLSLVGAALTGFGFSMIYPIMAVLMLQDTPPHVRGTAIGIYDAFFDMAMGSAGIVSGWLAARRGLPFAFFFAASLVAISGAMAIAAFRSRRSRLVSDAAAVASRAWRNRHRDDHSRNASPFDPEL
ncbi:UPF0226 protein YfcJ [Aureimonas endophytica]|uniref:UPF0226 protein YfcJ n=1 Tax=Aureimonas endophytica TaxID=2027858 RepID=A0A917EBZ5_9HYPH|nr:MFS transporter [Aureimonas endophytica]GGE21108.1 UPF0226 protein YfcJ [Aureimonas endophytica]